MDKTADAYRTISEVAEELALPQHVLRFWETRFPQIKPLKRGGGRRFYRPDDIVLLRAIQQLLYAQGYTIRGVQRILREQGVRTLVEASRTSKDSELAFVPAALTEGVEQDRSDASKPLEEAGRGEGAESAREESEEFSRGEEQELDPVSGEHAALYAQAMDRGELSATALSETNRQKLKAILAELLECQRILQNSR
jgi:DNA-binding transcriptional MerR regulator